MRTLILASASPRRKELLEQIGITPVIIPGSGEEKPAGGTPEEIVSRLAVYKSRSAEEKLRSEGRLRDDLYILGADTIVVKDQRILGKPSDEAEAEDMLQFLQGSRHHVFTGVSILRTMRDRPVPEQDQDRFRCFSVSTEVLVAPMDQDEIRAYVRTLEPMDKAGAYGIQGFFARHITGIRGDYTAVVGLPLAEVYRTLRSMRFYES